MIGKNQPAKPKESSKKSSEVKPLRAAVVIDAWFPGQSRRPGLIGGGQVHVRELTNTLHKKHGVEFTLFFPARNNFIYRLFWSVIVVARIIEHHHRQPFGLIHAHGINSGLAASWAGHIIKIPVIHTVHGSPLMDLKSKSIQAWFERQVLTNIKYAAQITVASSFLKYKNVNKNITVIRNAVDVSEFDAVEAEKSPVPSLIWVGGRQDRSKGLAYLKQAIVKIRKKYPDLKTKLITGGQLTGPALIKAYKRAHVFVLPSLSESQSITLLEAWAAKLPVVVTDVGDNAEMVKDGVNGYVVEPANVSQLTTAILKVLRARTNDKKMGENGYKLVKAEYTWNHVADKTWEVYQKVLGS